MQALPPVPPRPRPGRLVCGDFWATQDWTLVHVLPLYPMTVRDAEALLPRLALEASKSKRTRGEFVSDGINPLAVLHLRTPESDARIETAIHLGSLTGHGRVVDSGRTTFVVHPEICS